MFSKILIPLDGSDGAAGVLAPSQVIAKATGASIQLVNVHDGAVSNDIQFHLFPIKTHLEADFPARWNKPIDAAFPPYMLGATADQHRYGPFPPLAEKQRVMAEQRKADIAASKTRAAADPASAAKGK